MIMESIENLYEQYYNLLERIQENSSSVFAINLLQYDITQNYYSQVDRAVGLLKDFYEKYLKGADIEKAINERFQNSRVENIKFGLLIDVLRCYDGLDHPTSFTTPEGIALMILLGKILCVGEIQSYEQLKSVNSATLSLIDIIPYISECSDELGNKYSLLLSKMLEKESIDVDRLYRKLLYNLCKKIAEVDGEISISEKEWLNEIALLNDDDPDNDIDISGL
jgi:hypothetical protein